MQTPIGLNEMQVFVVPGWINRVLQRHKFSNRDLLDYSKIRSVVSLDDMAEWFHLNDQFKVDNSTLSTSLLDYHFHSATTEQKKEIRQTIVQLSYDDTVKSSALTRLAHANAMGQILADEELYEFITIDQTLFVVLNEGFGTIINHHQKKMEFIRRYLKACYAMTTIPFVSTMGVFKLYVNQLAIETR